jgi:EmrB/QacA subfamily drug resistance transporter
MEASMTEKSRTGGAVALAILLAGTFMTALDVSIVNVGAPKMQEDLGLSGAALQLVISGYSVAFAALLITGARLGDDRGHRKLFLGGLVGFTLTSLVCGLAWSPEVLVAARILQGASGAAMTPQVVTVIQLWFTGESRARALALYATVICAGAVVGQIVGGALVSADIAGSSWRPVFLVNVPVGIALMALGPRFLPHTRSDKRRPLDPVGVALLTDFVVLLMVPLVFGHQAHWATWVWVCLAAALPTGLALVLHLQREQRRGGDPLIDLCLLRHAPVSLGLTAVAAQMVAYGGFLFALTLHLQGGLGESPLRSGLTFGPYALGFAVTSLAAPMLPPRLVRRVATIGLAAMAAGYADLGLAADGGSWHDALMLPILAVAGAGFGAGYSPVIARAVAGVPAEKARDASGLLTTAVQLFYALGVATIGSQFLSESHGSGTGHAFAIAAGACAVLGLVAAVLTVALTRAEDRSRAGRLAVAAV